MERGDTELKDTMATHLNAIKNGVKLPAKLSTVILDYFINVSKIDTIEEVDMDDPDEMEAAGQEGWMGAFSEDLPKMLAIRVRKWAGAVSTSDSGKTLAGPIVGDVTNDDRRLMAHKEVGEMDLTSFEREKAIRDMADQGLSGKRMIGLSLSLCLGKVCKPSLCSSLKYGEDPALSDPAKQARKAGKRMLATVIKDKNFAQTGAFFSELMRAYSSDHMVEEASLIASWWAETASCFSAEKELLFEYLEEYFDKYAGRGLPVMIDTVLVTRLRNSAGAGAVTKEEVKALKNRLNDLEALGSKQKAEINTLKQQIGNGKLGGPKPTKEEQEERRKNVTCHNCGEKGHYKSECPLLAEKKDGKGDEG